MSWWNDGPEILGDAPADKLTAAWRRLLAARRDAGASRPSLDEVLRAFAAGMRAAPLEPPFTRLILVLPDERVREYVGDRESPGDCRSAFSQALDAIASDYRRRFERPPTPMEAAKTLQFVLAPHPGDYLDASAEIIAAGEWDLSAEPTTVVGAQP